MNLTLNDLVIAQQPLQRLVAKEMPARTAFHLARMVRQINMELQDYETARSALLKRFGTLSKDKSQYFIEPESRAEFGTEMQALHDTEIELNIVQIVEDDLPDLTAADAMALWWLVGE